MSAALAVEIQEKEAAVKTMQTELRALRKRKLEVEKEDIFPKAGEKVSSDAKKFIERLKKVSETFCMESKNKVSPR